jgi:hypothetical protein
VLGASCAVANIRPNSGALAACLYGFVGMPGYVVSTYDPISNALLANTATGNDGRYCVDGLPADSNVNIGILSTQQLLTPTGSGGGSCATNTCNAGPAIEPRL